MTIAIPVSEFILWGLLGSIVKIIVEGNGHITLPSRTPDGVKMGFLGNIILGTTVAVLVDHSTQVAFFSAISGSFVVERGSQRFRSTIDAILGPPKSDQNAGKL